MIGIAIILWLSTQLLAVTSFIAGYLMGYRHAEQGHKPKLLDWAERNLRP